MRIVWHASLALALVVAGECAAAAQESGKTGITMGYPASIGLIWHATDNIAIRPELTISGSSTDSGSNGGIIITTEGEGWAIGTGASALFYIHKYDRLRTYFSPRFTYSRTKTTTRTEGPVTLPRSTSKTTAWSGAGSFGAEYGLSDKFSAFGEVGFGFGRSKFSSSNSTIEPKATNWGTRTGVGVIFYF